MGITSFFQRVKRVLKWIPVIWKTWAFDHSAGLTVYQHSLKELKDIINNAPYRSPKHKKKFDKILKTMIALIDRINDENFSQHEKFLDQHYKKFGASKIEFIPTDSSKQYFRYTEMNKNLETEHARKEYFEIHKKIEAMNKRDRELLSAMIAKWGPHLWD